MINQPDEEERRKKISDLKDKIADCKDYINSDFCENCIYQYKKMEEFKQELNRLLNHQQ